MPVDQYMISFDFAEIANQVAVVQGSYTDFGRALKSSTSDIIDNFETLVDQVSMFQNAFVSVSSITDQQYLNFLQSAKQTASLFERVAKSSGTIVKNFDKIKNFDFRSLGSESPAERIEAVIPGGSEGLPGVEAQSDSLRALTAAKEAKEAADKAMQIVKKLQSEVGESGKKTKEEIKGVTAYIQKELKNARRSMQALASRSIPGGIVGGGLIGGLIATMILGVSEEQRRAKERGEMLNTFEAIGNVFSKQGQKAVNWFSNFQQTAQRYYGISKNQVQAVIKSMVDAGYSFEEIMSRASRGMSDVHSNVATLSMGLDAYFEMASGTAMSGMTELVRDYGDSLKEAANKYTDLMFAAQRSGMGVQKFVDAVRAGSSALTQYGIDVKDVAAALLNVKKHYEDLGMDSRAAGNWAGRGFQSVAQGMSAASDINVMVMMRRHPEMGYYEAKQALQEGWMEKNKAKRYGEQIQGILEFLEEKVGPDEAKQKEFLSQQPGWSYLGASTLMALKDNINNQGELVGATKDQMKELDKAFKTQGRTMSELQKTQHKLIDALYKVGKGLLQVVTGLAGTIITGFASIPMLIKALTLDGAEREKALQGIVDINNRQLAHVVQGFQRTASGAGELGSVLGETFKNIFPNFQGLANLNEAINKANRNRSWTQMGAQWMGFEHPEMLAQSVDESVSNLGQTLMTPFAVLEDSIVDVQQRLFDLEYEARVERRTRPGGILGGVRSEGMVPSPTPLQQRNLNILRSQEQQEAQTRSAALRRTPEPEASVPVQAPSSQAPVWQGASSIVSPKYNISAAAIHNSINMTQSKIAGEISR